MKIIQLTDLHIPEEGENTHGVDIRQNFQKILHSVRALSPDLIVVTGDICLDTGREQAYQWVRSHLDFLETPYTVIGGNHDHLPTMAKVFRIGHLMTGDELYYKRQLNGRTVLFLDTSAGEVSGRQLEWLEAELGRLEENGIVFMHHPPVVGGVPFMDRKYALRNMDAVRQVLAKLPHSITVFCGHYHVEKTICTANLTIHITPSIYFQIDCHAEAFKVDHYRIACREIILRDDGTVESTVIYRDGNMLFEVG